MLPVRNASVRTLGGFTIRFVLDQGFVGRANERALVGRLVSGVADGVGGVLLVVGEQGIGKSALLREALAGAGRLGCGVGWGVADELQQGFPLGVMVECLGAEGRRAVACGWEDGVGVTGGGWGFTGPVLAGDPVLAGAERLLAVVDRLCAVSPMVVVAEDLQWADEASLMVWRRLGLAVGQLPLLVVGSLRQMPAREEVARLARLARGVAAAGGVGGELGPLAGGEGAGGAGGVGAGGGGGVERGPLAGAEVAELAGRLLGAVPGRRLTGVLEQAGGNPLYVAELADRKSTRL